MLNQKKSSLTIILIAFVLMLLMTLKGSNVNPMLHMDQHRPIEENRSISPDVPYEDGIQPNSIK